MTHSDSPAAPDSLRRHFASRLELGVAIEPEALAAEGEAITRHFSRLTAENAMKWGRLCPVNESYAWDAADTIADFARRHGMKMTGHTLLWHQMQPPWLFSVDGAPISRSALTERLRDHVFRIVERYADVVDNWDVVNEAISDGSEFWRNEAGHSRWYAIFGNADFVELAFRFAAEAVDRYAPNTKLYYNDYNVERPDKRAKVVEMVRQLRARGVRIDGVGIQGHIHLTWPEATELGRAIDDFHGAGLLVKVSELDVSVYTEDNHVDHRYQEPIADSAELQRALAQRYRDIFRQFLAHRQQLTSIVLWGLSDDRSWLNGFPLVRPNYPLLFGRDHRPKAALDALLEL